MLKFVQLAKTIGHLLLTHSLPVLILSLLIVEGYVRLIQIPTLVPASATAQSAAIVKKALQGASDPEVAVMGSSRFMTGVAPTVLAERLGLPARRVVNISVDAGAPLYLRDTYQEHRSVLGNARVLVIAAEAWHFNWRFHMETTAISQFRNRASLYERAQTPSWRDKADLVAGWFWRTWDARTVLNGYASNLLRGGGSRPVLEVDALGRIMFVTPYQSPPSDEEARKYPHEFDFREYRISEVHLRALVELVALVRQDGLPVVLVDPPQSPVTLAEIEQFFAEEDALWRERVQEATGLPVETVPFNAPVCADWKDCYTDYGHLNEVGARAYSEAMGRWLLSGFPDLSSDSAR